MSYNTKQPYNEIQVPKLPVPTLKETMERYLQSVKPFVNNTELNVTISLIREFTSLGGIGERLQTVLEERARSRDNWLDEWWLNCAYMDYRESLVINSNTAVIMKAKEIISTEEQLQTAASVIASALDFKRILDEGKLKQHKMGEFALDMSQFYNVFGTCRIPGEKRDTLRRFKHGEHAKHIIVMRNYHFFVVNVYSEDGSRLHKDQILEQLRTIVLETPDCALNPFGILTSEKRSTWFSLRQKLLTEPMNREALEMIETSIMVVSLDAKPGQKELALETRNEVAARNVLCGGGLNSPNRWFDKAINFLIGYYGAFGVECEHSPSEGVILIPLCDYIVERLGQKDVQTPATQFSPPQKLDFIINNELQNALQTAQTNLQTQINNLEMNCFLFTDYGIDFIKSHKLSPDSFIQMAIQLAYYRFHGKPGAQYESASLRRFIHGRTEAIRSCSEQTITFCRAMLDPVETVQNKAKFLRTAINTHKNITLQAVSCQGVDRHLLGLRMAADELGMQVPQLFLDPAFTRSNHYCLSTSQVPMRHGAFNFFGPVVPDGYGICYNPRGHEITFGITAFKFCPETSASKMAEALQRSFLDMQHVVNQVLQANI